MTRAAAREARKLQLELPFPMGHAIDDGDVYEAVLAYTPEWVTRKQIADFIGRQVTPSLVARIERMVTDGTLEKQVFTLRNKAQGYQYRAAGA